MLRDTKLSIYQHLVYNLATERDFADALEKTKTWCYAPSCAAGSKYPPRSAATTPTQVVLLSKDGTRSLYFVVETKGSLFTDDMRDKEMAKIERGKAHFKTLAVGESPVHY
ncbi:hypothetical protein [Burkholderia gladioli]|uniref:restriction endonuclease n=1 Tax=Burkholderia gladioli TaxID=28095 RepID=UPI001FC84D3B|nr:hypothetical protein [Burkholderia gladioli]